jgi:hypothetical protein
VCFAVLGGAAFVGHVRHGGFYYDDWGVLSVVRFPPARAGALQALWRLYGRRPGEVVWYAALEGVLGSHPHWQLALAGALLVAEVVCLFALLRRLGMATLAAGAIAALVLLFPFSDSLWLWSILTTNTLTATLFLIGIALALRALDTPGWRGRMLHGISLALYLVGIFTYGEAFAVLGCLAGLLYVRSAGWRRARVRWGVDVVAIGASLAFIRVALPKDVVTPYPRLSARHMWLHAGDIASGAARVLAAAIEPLGRPAALLVIGLLVALLLARARDRRWLAVAAAGLAVAATAWVVYVPADYIYSPASPGTGNRVNGLAAIGLAIFLYASAVLILRRTALALLATTVLAAGYVHRIAADGGAWDRAASEQAQVLSTIRAHLQRPPAHAAFLVADWPQSAAPGVPVYGEPYYLSGALRWAFADPTLAGAQVDHTTRWSCRRRDVVISHLPYAPPLVAPYWRAYLVDVRADHVLALRRQERCQALARMAAGRHTAYARAPASRR